MRATRWGGWMVALGAALLVCGIFLKPPFVNAGLAVGLAGLLLTRSAIWRSPVVWIGAAFSAWLLLTIALAVVRGQPAAGRVPGVVFGWLALPVVAVAAVDQRWRQWTLRLFLAVALVAFAVAFAQWFIGIGEGPLRIDPEGNRFHRGRGFSDLSLTYGFASALLFTLALAPRSALGTGPGWRWTARGLGLLGLLLSGARGAMLGLAAGVSMALAARGRRWLLGALAVGLLILGVGMGALLLKSERRFSQMLAGENGRWAIWSATLVLVRDHPLVGVGGRNAYKAAYNEAYERAAPPIPNEFGVDGGAPHAHNTLLAFAAEHGLPAAALHLTLLGAVLVVAWRRRQVSPAGWQAVCGVLAVGVIAGMFEPYASRSVPGLGFHACLGFAWGLTLVDQAGAGDSAAQHEQG